MEIRHNDFLKIVAPTTPFENIATGFDFTEGPIWHPQEQALIFSDILGNSLYRWSDKEGLQKIRRHSYLANGNAYDLEGCFVTCEHATSRISRTNPKNGRYEILATHFQDKQLNSPNDIVVKSDGSIYFTDPTSGRSEGYGIPREPELDFSGVYRLNPENGDLTLLIDDFAKPNGLCFVQDESLLYVNDTERQHIRVFEVLEDGCVANGRLFANLVGDKPGVADGMKTDPEGNVYSCGPGGIHIFRPTGECLGVIETPEFATNLVFGDEDRRSLYITVTTSVYRFRLKVAGEQVAMSVGFG